MLKKTIYLILCLSLAELLQAMEPPISDETAAAVTKPKPAPIIFEDNEGSSCMHSIKMDDLAKYREIITEQASGTGGASSFGFDLPFRTSFNLSDLGLSHYHMLVFAESADSVPIAFFNMRRMPVFSHLNEAEYGKGDEAIIDKWKSLGVRQTVSDHDERVENFGLLNWVPAIQSSVAADLRKSIYQKMLAHSKGLRAAGHLMVAEKDPTAKSISALPNHVIVLLPRASGDIPILQELGFELDEKPEYAKLSPVPHASVMLTYNLRSTADSK